MKWRDGCEGFDSNSKSSEQRNVSKLLTLSSAVCGQSFVGELVQLTLSNILFDLAVPHLSVKLKKPSTESGKFRRCEILNFLFNIFDLTDGDLLSSNFSRVSRRGLTTWRSAANAQIDRGGAAATTEIVCVRLQQRAVRALAGTTGDRGDTSPIPFGRARRSGSRLHFDGTGSGAYTIT